MVTVINCDLDLEEYFRLSTHPYFKHFGRTALSGLQLPTVVTPNWGTFTAECGVP